jgi:hypothetical protein
MNNERFQKYALIVALIGTPFFLLMSAGKTHREPNTLLISLSGVLLIIFCCSLAATLRSGVAIGSGFQRFERKKSPGKFWFVVAAQIFVCCVFIGVIIAGMRP